MNKIEQNVIEFLEKHNLLNGQKKFIVGFSGGYDSLCLLHVLIKLSKKYNFLLVGAHLNHNWRGAESLLEEKTAENFCKENGIEFYSEVLSKDLPHTELEARTQRYEFYKRANEKFNADCIFTGHTLTDQVETVLYRVIKGTGINGLQGIPEMRYRDDCCPVCRPLLGIKREETIHYCEANNLKVNIDSSNMNSKYLRNSIRINLVPELKKYNSSVEESIVRLSEIASDYEKIINEFIHTVEKNVCINESELNTEKFVQLSRAVQKKIAVDFLSKQNLEYDYKKINEIVDFIDRSKQLKSGNTLSLTTNTWLFVSEEKIKLIHSITADVIKYTVRIDFDANDGAAHHAGLGKAVNVSPWVDGKPENFPNEKSYVAYVDLSKLNEPLYLRTRQEGDIIRPLGMNHRMKLKKYLINKGIPEHQRDVLPVIASSTEVLWIAGVGISELIRVEEVPTHVMKIV